MSPDKKDAMDLTEYPECLDASDECEGSVEYRQALSATGKSFARCDKHWELRLAEQERIQHDYPDSPSPPAWYDEAAAGELWSEE